MSETKQHAQVGFLFILSVLVLVAGIMWFKEFKVGGSFQTRVVEFSSTSGLLKGDPVEVKGVPSGKVANIRFEDGRALAYLHLDHDVHLRAGTRISIDNVGLMGQKVVAVYPGADEGEVLPPDSVLVGTFRAGIPEIMGGLGGTLTTFERLATRIDTLLMSFDNTQQEKLTRTLGNLDRVTGELALFMEDSRSELSASIVSFGNTMEDVHAMIDGRADQFGRVLDDASMAAARLDSTLTTLDNTVQRMDALLAKVESGEGSVGKAMNDEALYDELVVTLGDAKKLLQDIRENPRRYFKVSVF